MLNVDKSSTGLGAVIMQNCKPVAFSAKKLTTIDRTYANISRELLAIVLGAEKFYTHVYGPRIIAETDHKSLKLIFKKLLNATPPMLHRMLPKLNKYNLDVLYVPGKKQVISLA